MAEVLFYHLTESTLDEALPGLVERTLQRGWRAVVQTGTPERRDALDGHLWAYSAESFIGHGRDDEPFAADQPVLLTTGAPTTMRPTYASWSMALHRPTISHPGSASSSCSTAMTSSSSPPPVRRGRRARRRVTA